MEGTAFSLSAAPLFTAPAPSKIPHTSPQMPDANPALRGTLSSAGAGTPSLMKVATGGGVALAVAGMGQKRQRRKTQVRAVASDSASAEDAPPPPPPPFNPAKQIGAMAPLGYFDPAGFSKVGDKEGFNNLRAAEIKHGRVAMMAALGGVVQHFVKFPGFEKVPAGLSAVVTAPGSFGLVSCRPDKFGATGRGCWGRGLGQRWPRRPHCRQQRWHSPLLQGLPRWHSRAGRVGTKPVSRCHIPSLAAPQSGIQSDS